MKAFDIRPLRMAVGIRRQIVLAKKLGWNPETLADVEAGKIGIDDETHARIKDLITQMGEEVARASQSNI